MDEKIDAGSLSFELIAYKTRKVTKDRKKIHRHSERYNNVSEDLHSVNDFHLFPSNI